MLSVTFGDVLRYRRCPYEYQLDCRSGVWRVTATECMDMSVHDAVLASDQRMVMEGRPMGRDAMLSFYWDSWDRHFPDVFPPASDTLGLIRFGERCVENHIRMSSEPGPREIAAAGISGAVPLGDGREVIVPIDRISIHASTATVCRRLCDATIRSAEELSSDREMALCARWALANIKGCTRVRLRWEFLGSGTSVESSVRVDVMEAAVREMRDTIDQMEVSDDVLPRESDHCSECPYSRTCPRKLHENSISDDPEAMGLDDGVRLVDEYSEIQEKIDALKRRQQELEARRDAVGDRIVAFADANGFMAVTGHRCNALVRHERKVELPENKVPIITRLRETGQYDSLSIPNYSRLRSDIAKGSADPEIARLATITDVGKVYLRRSSRR